MTRLDFVGVATGSQRDESRDRCTETNSRYGLADLWNSDIRGSEPNSRDPSFSRLDTLRAASGSGEFFRLEPAGDSPQQQTRELVVDAKPGWTRRHQ